MAAPYLEDGQGRLFDPDTGFVVGVVGPDGIERMYPAVTAQAVPVVLNGNGFCSARLPDSLARAQYSLDIPASTTLILQPPLFATPNYAEVTVSCRATGAGAVLSLSGVIVDSSAPTIGTNSGDRVMFKLYTLDGGGNWHV